MEDASGASGGCFGLEGSSGPGGPFGWGGADPFGAGGADGAAPLGGGALGAGPGLGGVGASESLTAVPLFPLPEVVFFPCTLLPLHIFEGRYRAMVRDALAGDGRIVMAKRIATASPDGGECLSVHTVAGEGRIVAAHPLPGGRFHIVLCGVRRVRLRDVKNQATPYWTASLEAIPDAPVCDRSAEVEVWKARLFDRVRRLDRRVFRHQNLWSALRKLDAPLGCLTDLVADSLRVSSTLKQRLLEEPDPCVRARALITLTQGLLDATACDRPERAPGLYEPSLN